MTEFTKYGTVSFYSEFGDSGFQCIELNGHALIKLNSYYKDNEHLDNDTFVLDFSTHFHGNSISSHFNVFDCCEFYLGGILSENETIHFSQGTEGF